MDEKDMLQKIAVLSAELVASKNREHKLRADLRKAQLGLTIAFDKVEDMLTMLEVS
jgi:hypothetical protein